jgi:EKC/KEOPS complex subunit CGI121/TPRKB
MTALYSTVLGTIPTDPTSSIPMTKTHNLHSEILLGLSTGTNITDSIRRHGISNDSNRVLMVRLGGDASAEEVWEGMKALVEGDVVGLGSLDEGRGVDWSRVDKVCPDNTVAPLTVLSRMHH